MLQPNSGDQSSNQLIITQTSPLKNNQFLGYRLYLFASRKIGWPNDACSKLASIRISVRCKVAARERPFFR